MIGKENFEGNGLVLDLSVLGIGLKVYEGLEYLDKIYTAACKVTKSVLNKAREVAK